MNLSSSQWSWGWVQRARGESGSPRPMVLRVEPVHPLRSDRSVCTATNQQVSRWPGGPESRKQQAQWPWVLGPGLADVFLRDGKGSRDQSGQITTREVMKIQCSWNNHPPPLLLHLITQSSDFLALVQQGEKKEGRSRGEEWCSQSWSSLNLCLHVCRSEREQKILRFLPVLRVYDFLPSPTVHKNERWRWSLPPATQK